MLQGQIQVLKDNLDEARQPNASPDYSAKQDD